VAVPDLLQSGAGPTESNESDALAGAPRVGVEDEAHQPLQHLAGAGAGRSAVLARGGQELDASFPMGLQCAQPVRVVLDAVAAPCRPDADPFEERSCAAPVFAAQPAPPDVACSESLALRKL